LVSIHDVSPVHEERIGEVLEFLSERGVHCGALLVVPDFHGRWRLVDHPDFCGLVSERLNRGWELVLHGLTHRDDSAAPAARLRDRFSRRYLTDGEAEFLLLDQKEAAGRLERGHEMLLSSLGSAPIGFIPPAWLAGTEARQAIAAAGFGFTETHWHIEDLVGGHRYRIPAISWASRSLGRRASSRLWSRLMAPCLARGKVARVALHPSDFAHPSLIASIERTLARFLERDFTVSTYSSVLAELGG
jgi:predicted deacetylase